MPCMLVPWYAEFILELTCVTIAARHRSVDEMVTAVAKVASLDKVCRREA
jgi:hypothetical protein